MHLFAGRWLQMLDRVLRSRLMRLCLPSMRRSEVMRFGVVSFSLAVTLLTGAFLSPSIGAPVTISGEEQISAVIESIDPVTRQVLLRGPQGEMVNVTAGPQVRNLEQLKPGDHVVVTYREALAAELAKPGSSAPQPQVVEKMNRAAPGARQAQAWSR
jgi:hypothetical protein